MTDDAPTPLSLADREREEARQFYFDPADIVKPDMEAGPWTRPCRDCAFHRHDPQHLGAEVRAMLTTDVLDGEVDFYCVHRLTRRGLHRLCASAASLRARALAAQVSA